MKFANDTPAVLANAPLLFLLVFLFLCWLVIGPLSKRISKCRRKPGRPYSLVIHFGTKGETMLTINKDSPGCACTLLATDKEGVTVTLPSPPVWSIDDASYGTITAAADGMSAMFVPAGKVGQCNIKVHAEGDATVGVDPLDAVGQVNVVEPEASQIAVGFGTPQ